MPGKEIIYENTSVISVDKRVNIIHFNDVYNIESSTAEPAAGAARFITAIESLVDKTDASDPNTSTIVLFSGDAISPSSRTYHPFSFRFKLNTSLNKKLNSMLNFSFYKTSHLR